MRAFRWIGREREVVAALVVQVLVLLPVLRTPYRFDDAFNAAFAGGVELQGGSWIDAWWQIVETWFVEQGRFFPLAGFQTYGQFVAIDSLLGYKLLLIAWVVVATIAVVALLRRLGASPAIAALVAIGATLTMQMRNYHDPLYGYAGLQQAVLAYMALSALLFHVWLRDRRWWALTGSLLLIGVATMTYESAPLLCGLHLVVAVAERRSAVRGLVGALPALATGAAFLMFSLYLRSQASAPSGAYEAVIDPVEILPALGNQLLGAVPLSYVGLNPGNVFLYRGELIVRSMGLGSILIGVALGALVWWLVRRAASEETRTPWGPVLALALGVVLLLAPAAPISLAARYQGELLPGLAYLPVFIEGFGVALILVALLMFARSRAGTTVIAVGAVVLGLGAGAVASVSHRANTVIADSLQGEKQGARTLSAALEQGVVDGAPAGVRVYTAPAPPAWLVPGYFTMHDGDARFSEVVPVPGVEAIDDADPASGDAWYFAAGQHHVVAGPLAGGPPVRVFLSRDKGASYAVLDASGAGSGRVFPDGDEDRLITLPAGSSVGDVAVVAVPQDSPTPAVGFAGCGGPEPGVGQYWCDRRGAIAVINPSDAPVRVTFAFGVVTPEPGGAAVRVLWDGGARTVRAAAEPVRVTVPLTVPAGGASVVRLRTDSRRVPAAVDPRRWAMLLQQPSIVPR